LPRKFGSRSSVALMPLLSILTAQAHTFSLPSALSLISPGISSGGDEVPFQRLPKPASPHLSANSSCLLMVLATSYSPQLISHNCCQPGKQAGPGVGTRQAALGPRLAGPDHTAEALLMDGQGSAAPFQIPPYNTSS